MANIRLTIKKDKDTGEFVIPWYQEGKYKEGPTYYTDDLLDAKETLVSMYKEAVKYGHDVEVRENKYTIDWKDYLRSLESSIAYSNVDIDKVANRMKQLNEMDRGSLSSKLERSHKDLQDAPKDVMVSQILEDEFGRESLYKLAYKGHKR